MKNSKTPRRNLVAAHSTLLRKGGAHRHSRKRERQQAKRLLRHERGAGDSAFQAIQV